MGTLRRVVSMLRAALKRDRFEDGMADELRFVATEVTGGIVPASGHWIMEENPQATTALVSGFIAK